MKFLALLYALILAVPLCMMLRASPAFTRLFWVVVGALPFLAPGLPVFDIGLVSWADTWVGYVYGLEVTVLDIAMLAAFFAFRGSPLPLWLKLPALVFGLALALSMGQADEPMAAFFGVWQYARMVLLMIVVAHACRADQDVAPRILLGMVVGIGVQLAVSLEQRLFLGFTQARGLFVHQNTLGMIAHMVLVPHLAMLLHRGTSHSSTFRNLVGVGAAASVAILTASRGTIGMAAAGMALTYGALALSHLTLRKIAFAGSAALVLVVAGPLAYSTLENRFHAAPLREDVYDERAAFAASAKAIVADHPFGVGTNHYVHIARDEGYSYRAGVARGSRESLVHNAFWLTAAEAGWFGMAAFIAMLATPLVTALVVGWRVRGTFGGHLIFGLGLSLVPVYLQSLYEWVIYAREVQYVLFTTMGMTFGLALAAQAHLRKTAAAAPHEAPGAARVPA
ncbi:O-antigen ligase family protein [Aureimonas sp. ME7]|uniref:O-antigen ligase family protein n=1 Tax=Aureimonas sp. ME7 TaxID=2744252 RepID=UPI0015F461CF|nr:O-antigen ligase family protein [Aureimonas sp. ME7]